MKHLLIIIILLLAGCSMKSVKTPNGWELLSISFLESEKAKEAGAYYIDPNGVQIGFGVTGYESTPELDAFKAGVDWALRGVK